MLRRIRLLAPFLALLLLISTITPVSAADPVEEPLSTDEAIELLQTHFIVRGDESGNLNLDAKLTRAQAAAIFVRAMNMSAFTSTLAGDVPFSDAKGHWGAGEIAMANQIGLMKGDPGGRFRPDAEITYAEVLTVLLRMVEREPTGQWAPAVIMSSAAQAGILPDGISSSTPAVREQTFWALAQAMTLTVDGGPSLLKRSFDVIPPELEVDDPESSTTAPSITLTGKATGAFKVMVDGRAASFQKNSAQFSAKVDLDMGTNYVQVEAIDRAGNRASTEVAIERRPEISKIEIKGPVTIAPESKQKLEVKAYDAKGKEVPLGDLKASLSTKEHSFDLEKMTLTTGEKRGKATLTLTAGKVKGTYSFDVQGPSDNAEELKLLPINDGRALAPDKEYTVTVQILNDDGRVVADDYGRKVALVVEDMSGVDVTPDVAETVKGVATFTIEADHEGVMNLKVTSSGLDTVKQEIQVLTSPRIVLSTTAKSLAPDGTSTATIKATLMDDMGKAVNNNKSDIELEVFVDESDGYIENAFLTIPRGRSAASGAATFVAGYEPGTAEIRASVDSDHDYSVQSLEIPVDAPLSGAKFELKATPSPAAPGEEVTVTLRVTDEKGRTDSKASYGFVIKLSTSNRDRVVNGIPAGVEFHFKGADYTPVYGGDDEDVYVITGRTYKGTAEMTLRYDGSGVVRLSPMGVTRTSEAYNPIDGFGAAASTKGYEGETLEVRFANKPVGIELIAETRDDEGADVLARPGRPVKLIARVVDEGGSIVPGYDEMVTLTRIADDKVTSIEGSSRVRTQDGEAEFEVWVYNGVGSDRYQASVGSWKSNEVTITVDND